MLNFFKNIFIWWNQQTIGTMIYTFFYGKFIGKDEFENKYYQSKSGKRWVIYSNEVDSTTISNDWYPWMHFLNNKIPNKNDNKYQWEKPREKNLTGSDNAYRPKKIKDNKIIKKKYETWKI